MIIAVGSQNSVKVQAVKEVISDYSHLSESEVIALSVPSEISEQPMDLEEIISGAKNRARNAFQGLDKCSLSFGIESGFFPAVGTKTGYLEACICVIFNGENYYTGLSCGFEVPPQILSQVVQEKLDLSQACFKSGITTNPKLGAAEGLIGILSKGRINRMQYTKQCVLTALMQLDHAHLY